jgi:hypothetical protein
MTDGLTGEPVEVGPHSLRSAPESPVHLIFDTTLTLMRTATLGEGCKDRRP